MFNLFNKKPAQATPQPHPSVGSTVRSSVGDQVFESGKELQFKDPKTQEFVYQRAISPEQRKEIFAAMQENAGCANNFMQLSRQLIMVQKKLIEEHEKIEASEKKINEIIGKIRDELKLDRRWGFNMQLGVLERRDPPGE